MKPKATNPRNKHRGTKLTQFRFGADTTAQIATIREHLSGLAHGAEVSAADAVRLAVARMAKEIASGKTLDSQ